MNKEYPFDEFAEKTILGIAILDKKQASNIMMTLDEDDFYAENGRNAFIFNAMKLLNEARKAIDITTVATKMIDLKTLDKVGGIEYLEELTNCVTTFKNVEFYVDSLKEKTLLRNLLKEIDKIRGDYDTKEIKDIGLFVSDVEQRINKITQLRRVSDFTSAREAAATVGKSIIEAHGIEGTISGITTGFGNLDNLTNGFGKGELVIVAARPSVGKSALALNIAYLAAKSARKPIAIFSLEMSVEMILKRLFAMTSSINYENIQKGILSNEQRLKLKESAEEIANVPLFIDDNSGTSVDDIVLKSRKLKETYGEVGMVVVDYIGLINDPKNIYKDNEQAKIAYFSRKLKTLAMELECPVLCVAQLNRQTDLRDNKKPQLADLRSSGAIEQDADKVLFLYRPAYYEDQGFDLSKKKHGEGGENSQSDRQDQNAQPIRNENGADNVEVLVAKNRSGKIGTCNLFFMKTFGRFFRPQEENEHKIRSYDDFE